MIPKARNHPHVRLISSAPIKCQPCFVPVDMAAPFGRSGSFYAPPLVKIAEAVMMMFRGTGMLLLQKPSVDRLHEFLTAQSKLDFTHSAVGATAAVPPAGYVVDRTRIKLGEGAGTFAAAKDALRRWEHFRLGWVEAWPSETPIQAGQVVAVIARLLGLWWLNACRIVYVVDEEGPVTRYGFAYGTLPEHAESGEERFTVEWHEADGAVWYDILAFSRPQQLVARLGYPFARRLRKRFARDSAAVILQAVVEDK